jgi:hypothetical protein
MTCPNVHPSINPIIVEWVHGGAVNTERLAAALHEAWADVDGKVVRLVRRGCPICDHPAPEHTERCNEYRARNGYKDPHTDSLWWWKDLL